MKSFKKLSTYFFVTLFFVALYPSECNWPNPSEDGVSGATVTQITIDNDIIDITAKLS